MTTFEWFKKELKHVASSRSSFAQVQVRNYKSAEILKEIERLEFENTELRNKIDTAIELLQEQST